LRSGTVVLPARVVASASRAIDAIRKTHPEIIFLDRDLVGPSFGEDVAEFLADGNFAGRVYVTSANPFGVEVISKILGDAGITLEAVPFQMMGVVCVPLQERTLGVDNRAADSVKTWESI
jgi:hypothetical protein